MIIKEIIIIFFSFLLKLSTTTTLSGFNRMYSSISRSLFMVRFFIVFAPQYYNKKTFLQNIIESLSEFFYLCRQKQPKNIYDFFEDTIKGNVIPPDANYSKAKLRRMYNIYAKAIAANVRNNIEDFLKTNEYFCGENLKQQTYGNFFINIYNYCYCIDSNNIFFKK